MGLLGEIPGYPPGTWFGNRRELASTGVHRENQRGICWIPKGPAESIVVSGGYEDDQDWGDTILYTGMGGSKNGIQIRDQGLEYGNLALMRSFEQRTPVRVVRGSRAGSRFSPAHGLRYDGLFRVTDAFYEPGRSGFRVWRFVLTAVDALEPAPMMTDMQMSLIELYRARCQVCGIATRFRTGMGASAFHIKPQPRPHCGTDDWSNLLCLCPNHATEMSFGALSVQPDLTILGTNVRLRINPRHELDHEALTYRALRYGFAAAR